jgi:GTP-binding protein HflX
LTAQERSNADPIESVILVTVGFRGRENPGHDAEMVSLIDTAGGRVHSIIHQNLVKPDPGSFVGRGKALEIAGNAESSCVSTVVFDHNLTPGQVARLERITNCKVIDRTELILAIFARNARTVQARLQIELAQLRYTLPRLSGMWHHFSRLGAGIGTRGPGETQLEVDRRRARTRIAGLESRLASLETGARLRRSARADMFKVSLVGYTNAGKSSLLNALCGASALVENRLFATLDTTSRRLPLPGSGSVLLSDTVGFIDRLPETLMTSFRSTLDVVREADLLLMVADGGCPEREERLAVVTGTLERIGAGEIPRITVWSKCDLWAHRPVSGVSVSSVTGEGLGELLEKVSSFWKNTLDWYSVSLDIPNGGVENWIRKNCLVESTVRTDSGGLLIYCAPLRGSGELISRVESSAGNILAVTERP